MFQKCCATNQCQCWGPLFHTRHCQCTPAPPTGVPRATGQQAGTSPACVKSMGRGVVSVLSVKVGEANVTTELGFYLDLFCSL